MDLISDSKIPAMKKYPLLLISLLLCLGSMAQLGVKAGLNFITVNNSAGINANSRSGYFVGAFFGPRPKKLFGYRSEIMLSRQGYDYKSASNSGNVNLDYLLIPQLFTLNFTKKVEVHAGLQLGFLLNATADSSGGRQTGLLDYFNRFNYSLAGGLQVSPVSGMIIGARMNISVSKLNEDLAIGGSRPAYIAKDILRNNVIQLYAGWRF